MTQWYLILSDIFSFITIALCLILKIPQIFSLIKSGKAAGLSLKALLLELTSYTVTMMYNFTNQHTLLSYLEYPIIIIQEYILIGCVMHYKNYKPVLFLMILTFCITICLGFAFNIITKFILTLLLPFTIPVSAISKIIQLIEIMTAKNADSISLLTWFLSMFTNITRIYTTYVDSADITLLLNYSVSSLLSGAIMGTAFYYQRLQSGKKLN